jgi:anaerobic nitric oxide reductase transcription regulator
LHRASTRCLFEETGDTVTISSPLLDAALSLSDAPNGGEALAGILRALARATRADALAILAAGDDGSLGLACQLGLSPGTRGLRFVPREHPRLARSIAAARPVRFHDPREPDPYDGLLAGTSGPVDPIRIGPRAAPTGSAAPALIHACLATPLFLERRLVGVLTLDALDPRGLDAIGDDDVRIVAALAASALARAPAPALGPPRAPAGRLIGRSRAMARLAREIEVLAPRPTTVLITGETGTGKELVARALHEGSPRAARPLVVVNCAALPAHLVESELFGHKKGAYTGAATPRAGRFEAADGSTILLDEVGELPLEAQALLLRTLQEGEIQRVGEDRPRRVDVRVLAATHRDLWRDVAEGRFRADLLHRLWVYPIHVAPLRDREGDVALLAEHFVRAAAARLGVEEAALSPDALDRLARHTWPGNARELEHAVERGILRRLTASPAEPRLPLVVRTEDLDLGDEAWPEPVAAETLEQTLDRARRAAFARAFRASSGNAAEAARRLGLSRSFAYKEGLRLGLLGGAGRKR